MLNSKDLFFETNKHIYNFQQYSATRSFAKHIFGSKITFCNDEGQSSLLV